MIQMLYEQTVTHLQTLTLASVAVGVLFTNNLLILYKFPQLGFKCTNEPEQCSL